jgi:pSer/pThr/pTyr-binding forkhead associated (FHA) protein
MAKYVAMARLILKSDGSRDQVIELHLGLNRLGRSPENDFQIEHSSVSAVHCELILGANEVTVRDCDSTNGTFIDGQSVKEAHLQTGQILSLGDVELLVESTDVRIAIPKFEVPRPAPPVVLSDGSLICPRHPRARVTHQCTHCRELMCDACVHRLRRRGGKMLKLCPLCSHQCEPLSGEVRKKKKKTLLGFLQKTVKLPLLQSRRKRD